MRKRTRKLSLSRETLHQLAPGDLGRVGGGNTTTNDCKEGSDCACATDGCGGTGSFCPTMTICSNC